MAVDVCFDRFALLVVKQRLRQGSLVGEDVLFGVTVPGAHNRAYKFFAFVRFEGDDGTDADFVRGGRIEIENRRAGNVAFELGSAGAEEFVVFARHFVFRIFAQVAEFACRLDCEFARGELVLDDVFEFFAARSETIL